MLTSQRAAARCELKSWRELFGRLLRVAVLRAQSRTCVSNEGALRRGRGPSQFILADEPPQVFARFELLELLLQASLCFGFGIVIEVSAAVGAQMLAIGRPR